MNKPPYWFKRKRYGYGWTPASTRGWLLTLAYIAALLIPTIFVFKDGDDSTVFFIIFTAATLGYVTLAYLKSPKAKWRWGSKPEDNPSEDY